MVHVAAAEQPEGWQVMQPKSSMTRSNDGAGGGLEPPTTCLHGPGTRYRDVHLRLWSGLTEPRKRLNSGHAKIGHAVAHAYRFSLSWRASARPVHD